jgi:hypothetical protein
MLPVLDDGIKTNRRGYEAGAAGAFKLYQYL